MSYLNNDTGVSGVTESRSVVQSSRPLAGALVHVLANVAFCRHMLADCLALVQGTAPRLVVVGWIWSSALEWTATRPHAQHEFAHCCCGLLHRLPRASCLACSSSSLWTARFSKAAFW
ncbi:hypothetical protein CSUI_004215 [Cystoisospora suis]|uniref:Uncharacterized protein n=1 Tax=Cystoisospora suis TaxID=483139 RepID=A0A2C6KZJ9_9APIC|nr:hypothetical protein CSUI_004215 [Cystoisospora suis]